MLRIAFPKGRDLTLARGHVDDLLRDVFGGPLWVKRRAKYIWEWAERPNEESTVCRGVFMRAREIPALVARGNYDMGICGYDWVEESGEEKRLYREAPLSPYVDVVLFCGKDDPLRAPTKVITADSILSEYPSLTQRELKETFGYTLEVVPCSGSAESHVPHDYRFGVCVRETGKTLEESHQRVLCVLYTSGITLIANLDWYQQTLKITHRLDYESLYGAIERT